MSNPSNVPDHGAIYVDGTSTLADPAPIAPSPTGVGLQAPAAAYSAPVYHTPTTGDGHTLVGPPPGVFEPGTEPAPIVAPVPSAADVPDGVGVASAPEPVVMPTSLGARLSSPVAGRQDHDGVRAGGRLDI